MPSLAILMTVHNRRQYTLACLGAVFAQQPVSGYHWEIYLTDDGCTDGTPEAIAEKFPSVHIIKGDGNLYWNRGMYKAWEAAAKEKDFDFYLWLNDDTILFEDSIKNILEDASKSMNKSIIVGSTRSERGGNEITYGGLKNNKLVIPNGYLQRCDTFNGNVVLVPSAVFKKIGNLDWTFRHAIGDLDYGYRAGRAGFENFVSSKYLGICEEHSSLPVWTRKDVPLSDRMRNLYSPLGYAQPFPFFHYELRNFGFRTAVKHFVTAHIRVLFPGLWNQ